jgi:hypothetical protein
VPPAPITAEEQAAAVQAAEAYLAGPDGTPADAATVARRGAQALDTLLGREPGPVSPEEAALLALVVTLPDVRDALYRVVAAGPDPTLLALLLAAVRLLPPSACGVAAALLALCHWCQGDGARANVALDRATDADPTHPTVRLVGDVVAAGVPPAVVRSTLQQATAA